MSYVKSPRRNDNKTRKGQISPWLVITSAILICCALTYGAINSIRAKAENRIAIAQSRFAPSIGVKYSVISSATAKEDGVEFILFTVNVPGQGPGTAFVPKAVYDGPLNASCIQWKSIRGVPQDYIIVEGTKEQLKIEPFRPLHK